MARVQRISEALMANLYPDEEGKKVLVEKFTKLSNGKDYIVLDEYEAAVRGEINGEGSRYLQLKEAQREQVIKRRVNMIETRDANKDGRVSQSEYMNAEFHGKLDSVLSGTGDGYDGVFDDAEILTFLQKWTVCEKDVDAMKKAFGSEQEADKKGLKTQDVIDGLYNLVCPPAKV